MHNAGMTAPDDILLASYVDSRVLGSLGVPLRLVVRRSTVRAVVGP